MVHHIGFHTTRSRRRRPAAARPVSPQPRNHPYSPAPGKTCIRTPVRSEYGVAPHTPRLGRGPADTLPELPRRPGTVSSQGWNRSVRLRHHASHTSLRTVRHSSFHTAARQAVRAACVGRPLYKTRSRLLQYISMPLSIRLTFIAEQCPKTHANPRNPRGQMHPENTGCLPNILCHYTFRTITSP